jgi:hypothetical protein
LQDPPIPTPGQKTKGTVRTRATGSESNIYLKLVTKWDNVGQTITAKYKDKGYITSQAVLLQQRVKDESVALTPKNEKE